MRAILVFLVPPAVAKQVKAEPKPKPKRTRTEFDTLVQAQFRSGMNLKQARNEFKL